MYIRLVVECSGDGAETVETCVTGGQVDGGSLEDIALVVEQLVSEALLQRFTSIGVIEVALYHWAPLDP